MGRNGREHREDRADDHISPPEQIRSLRGKGGGHTLGRRSHISDLTNNEMPSTVAIAQDHLINTIQVRFDKAG